MKHYYSIYIVKNQKTTLNSAFFEKRGDFFFNILLLIFPKLAFSKYKKLKKFLFYYFLFHSKKI